jgi:uncharacterized membrane protein SirB2
MESQPDYWVLAGTVAPVIAVIYTVSLSATTRRLGAFMRATIEDLANSTDDAKVSRFIGLGLRFILYFSAFAVNVLALGEALYSLDLGRDAIPRVWETWLLVSSFALPAVLSYASFIRDGVVMVAKALYLSIKLGIKVLRLKRQRSGATHAAALMTPEPRAEEAQPPAESLRCAVAEPSPADSRGLGSWIRTP